MWDKMWIIIAAVIVIFLLKLISNGETFRKIKFYSYFFACYLSWSVIASFMWVFYLKSPRNVKNCIRGSQVCKHTTKIFGVNWDLRNGEILAEERGAIIVANHQSSLDIIGMWNIWEVAGKMTAVCKRELLYAFPFGFTIWLAGLIFIDRRDKRRAMAQLRECSDVMIGNKTKIWLFPEGTRNRDRSKLLPFKKGAFVMAVYAQVPIIPIVISPYYFIDEEKYVCNRGGQMVIKCLEPVPTKGLSDDDIPALMDKIHKIMEDEYLKLSKQVLENVATT